MSSMLKGEAAAQSSISAFMYRQWFVHPKAVSSGTTLVGQVAIITGSNTGLGLEAARQLLQLNLTRLVIAVRSRFKGDAAAQSLRNEFPKAQIDVWIVDMERYDSILSFVEKCKTLPQIDMVVLNAGVENSTFKLNQTTKHEMSFQVNYLSTMLLAILLLPVLKGKKVQITRPARLCVVTSISACWTELENEGPILKSFDKEEGYTTLTWYAREKLLQQLFFAKLADQISPEDVVINFVCPGLVRNTGLSQTPGFGALAIVLFKHTMGRNMQVGASVYVDAVLRGKESHGSFVADWGIRPYPPIMYTKEGEEFQQRLWEETLAELGFADVSKICAISVLRAGLDAIQKHCSPPSEVNDDFYSSCMTQSRQHIMFRAHTWHGGADKRWLG